MRTRGWSLFRARNSEVTGFLYMKNSQKKLKNFSSSVFKGNFRHIFTHINIGFYPLTPRASRRRGARRGGAHAPYCLQTRPHGLHQRVIANAAAGIANPPRVSYSDNAIARFGDTNARGVSNANARGVCVCNLRRPGDAHRPVGLVMLPGPLGW